MDPAVTPPPGQDVQWIALVWMAATAAVGFLVKVGDLLVKWLAKRLRVSDEDEQASKIERLERELGELRRDREASGDE